MGTLRRRCATVPQPSELRFGVVRAVGRCVAVLDGAYIVQREGGGFGVFPIFTMGNAIGSPTVQCFRFVCENFTTFQFGKHIVGKLDLSAFWRYIQFQHQCWVYQKLSENVTIVLRKLRPTQQRCRRNMHIHE